MNIYDEYEKARELAKILKDEGHNELAETLLDDIRNGSTGTEIFTGLRFHILQFLAFPDPASHGAIELARDLYEHLDAKLQ